MNSHRTPGKTSALRRLGAVVVLLIAVVVWWTISRRPAPVSPRALPPQAVSAATNRQAAPAVSGIPTNKPMATQSAPNYEWFRKRPLGVSRESSNYEWTAEDGKDTNVIRRLAHNDLEYQHLVEENSRIISRQLVYCNETADIVVERSRLSGKPVQQLTLPGLDGREVQFEITSADLSPSGQQGAFAGHVTGHVDSTVTLAFKGGREAFTILSPSDGLYLQGDPREPGELIVKSINPETYVVGVCGNP
jgi:hypothetical protein